nr:hypothetical protein [Tanacetum cinerariifolium]
MELGSQTEVPIELKGKSVDTHEGTALKLGVPDVSKAESSESDYQSWVDSRDEDTEYQQDDEDDTLESDDDLQQDDDERTDSENQMTNNEEEEFEEAFEEYERISKELYGAVNVKLTDAEHNDKEKGDAAHVQVEQIQEQTTRVQEESGLEMASIQGQYVVQDTTTMTPTIQNATTTKVPSLSSSHFVSSTYTNAFLNLENLHSIEMKVVFMLEINIQHEVLRTSPLLTIHVSVTLNTLFPSI